VLGVSLSGTLLQAILLSKLQQRIQGPNAEEACLRVLSHSPKRLTTIIAYLTYKVNHVPFMGTEIASDHHQGIRLMSFASWTRRSENWL